LDALIAQTALLGRSAAKPAAPVQLAKAGSGQTASSLDALIAQIAEAR
jgi:hypothetical protein